MQLQWQQLDPQVAAKIGAGQEQAAAEAARRERARKAQEAAAATITATAAASLAESPQPLEPIWSAYALLVAVVLVGLYAALFFHWGSNGGLILPLMLGPVGLVGLGMLVGTVAPVQERKTPAKTYVSRSRGTIEPRRVRRGRIRAGGTLQAGIAAAAPELTRAERLYAETILLLVEDTPATATSTAERRARARLGREIVREGNHLLRSHDRLDIQKRRLLRQLRDGDPLERADAEYADLRRRWEAETDPLARESLRESIALCAERRESLRALVPALARLEAHQEVICQTLSLAQTALARRQAASGALQSFPDVSALRAAARHAIGEAQAEEDALAEFSRF